MSDTTRTDERAVSGTCDGWACCREFEREADTIRKERDEARKAFELAEHNEQLFKQERDDARAALLEAIDLVDGTFDADDYAPMFDRWRKAAGEGA